MDAMQRETASYPDGSFRTRVTRRHVDLLRVSSVLCRETPAVR
ncbi:hypothetical protein [Streptomyces sp. NBC_01198]|nr:hypothetical protein OG702_15390 [Streptomyces sp. NBC_01198]